METIPGIFCLLSVRRSAFSRRALGFLARVQFQLSAGQRENVIRRFDIYLATPTENYDGPFRRKLWNSGAVNFVPHEDNDRNFFSVGLLCLSPREKLDF